VKRALPRLRSGVAARRLLVYGLAAAVVLLDQLSKLWALRSLAGGPQPLLPGLLDLRLAFNTGAAFSLFSDGTTLLALVSLAVVAAVVVWLQRQRSLSLWRVLAVGFLLGGAAGNGIDRWRSGAVVDFLALVPIAFPVFNLADVAINLAVLCLAVDLLRSHDAPDG